MVSLRLSIMMFLQFFVWGSWYVTAYLYLDGIGFGGAEIGWTYSVGPIAGMISPFFVGIIADRFFSTERILGVMHLAGGATMFVAASLMDRDNPVSPALINLLFFAHMLCYFPTLSLTNSLALHNMTHAEKQFPLIRVFGTIGWIVAGVVVSLQEWDAAINMFYLASGAAVVMGLYSFTLPHTPPPSAGQKPSVREILGVDAFVLLKKPSFLAFMVSSFLVCIPLAFYYQMAGKYVDHTGQPNVALRMSFGQMSEIFFMLVMPLFFARLGVKWMLFVGMLAWVVRYGLFGLAAADGTAWMVLTGIILHGICYDFFFVTGQIYTDRVAPSAIRGQAQGMLVLFTLGLGMFIGAQVAGKVEDAFVTANAEEMKAKAAEVEAQMATAQDEVDQLLGVAGQPTYVRWMRTLAPKEIIAADAARVRELETQLDELREKRSEFLLKTEHWNIVWFIPCVFAGVIMLLFAVVFRDDTKKDDDGKKIEGDETFADPSLV